MSLQALTGLKLMSRSPCVITASSIVRNGHFGLLLRDRARATVCGTEMCDNTGVRDTTDRARRPPSVCCSDGVAALGQSNGVHT